jgi:uncharacterized protein
MCNYKTVMTRLFEWDDEKDRTNRLKHHGISFAVAARVFDDPWHQTVADRDEGREQRWITVGSVGGVTLLLVVHTSWHAEANIEVIRMISARKATKRERRCYESQND